MYSDDIIRLASNPQEGKQFQNQIEQDIFRLVLFETMDLLIVFPTVNFLSFNFVV